MRVLGVQVGRVRPVQIGGRRIMTALGKQACAGPVSVGVLGLAGDEQADASVHGGRDKAVYAYPSEHYPLWQHARRAAGLCGIDDSLPWGSVGENLSLQGLTEADVWVGDRLCFADCVLRVTLPREPCHKFAALIGLPDAAKRMAQHGACGFYLAVDVPGTLRPGEDFTLQAGPRQMPLATLFATRMRRRPA